MKTYELRRLKI